MKIIDLNVLLYAVNEDSVHHRAVLEWWERALNASEPVGLAWIVLLGFLRLSTNPRVFPRPLTAAEAARAVDRWLSLDNTRLVTENEDHWTVLRSLLSEAGTAGNLTNDAHLAALAMSRRAALVSCDGDFARFRGLLWENPLR